MMQENQEIDGSQTKADVVFTFLEHPKTPLGIFVQIFIFALIFLSIGLIVVEIFYPEIFKQYAEYFEITEYIILAVFTAEYFIRFFTARKKLKWMVKPLSIVDFLAIFPNYIELLLPFFFPTTALRIFRILRFLRFLRILRLFRYKSVFSYRKTVLQQITPMIVFFIIFKVVIWMLEKNQLWFVFGDLKELGALFTIIGFALGIILSQKIGVAYNKFTNVDETVVKIVASLRSLKTVLNSFEAGLGTNVCFRWAKCFQHMMQHNPTKEAEKLRKRDPDTLMSKEDVQKKMLEQNQKNIDEIFENNDRLYLAIKKVENQPSELSMFFVSITHDAYFCVSKRTRCTPRAYDTLLHQSTIFYFILMVLLLPGLVGLISVSIATYVLYGMYFLTKDFDSLLGGDYDLVDICTDELDSFVEINSKSEELSDENKIWSTQLDGNDNADNINDPCEC